MSRIVNVIDHPTLDSPTLIVGLEGWIDAGMSAATAVSTMVSESSAQLIASFDTDVLLDYRARRPVMNLNEGLVTEFRWAEIELFASTGADGQDVLLLTGPEPDRCWKEFTNVVVDLAQGLDVSQVIGLGAYPAPVPHTRPTRLALTTASRAISDRMHGYVRGSLEVPAGMFGALEQKFHEVGTDAFCLWAQVPHYASNLPFPAASLALIEGVNNLTRLGFATGSLATDAAANRLRLDELIAANPDHATLVKQLESFADAETQIAADVAAVDFSSLPSGDELAEEFQAFLRESDGHPGDGSDA